MNTLKEIGERICTQDNRCTSNPMFCVQILVRDAGYDAEYMDQYGWWSAEDCEWVYEEPSDYHHGPKCKWRKFGYKDRWETVMVAFTEKGCQEYLELDGHNVRRKAHNSEVRIYVESLNRCPEMIAIREFLKAMAPAE